MNGINKKGFTLIELALSIAFISVLSITIVLIISDTVVSYQRGMTLNKINTVGMELVDDIRATIQSASAKALVNACGSVIDKCDNVQDFASVARRANVTKGSDTFEDVPVYGAFCNGAYSYIWNSGYLFDDYYVYENDGAFLGKARFIYNLRGIEKVSTDFKLLKIRDKNFAVCKSVVGDEGDDEILADFTLNEMVYEEPEELLAGENNNLAIYDLYSGVPATNSDDSVLFYSVSFILGTVNGGIDVTAKGDFCKPPKDYNSNFNYCAINKFNFAAQAIGGL